MAQWLVPRFILFLSTPDFSELPKIVSTTAVVNQNKKAQLSAYANNSTTFATQNLYQDSSKLMSHRTTPTRVPEGLQKHFISQDRQ